MKICKRAWRKTWITSFTFGFIFEAAATAGGLSTLQDSSQALLYCADRLFLAQDYEASITEYGRFLFFHPSHRLAFYAHYKAGMSYRQLEQWQPAVTHLRRALQSEMPAALRGRVRYQLALLWIANGDFDLAQLELFKVSQTDSNRALREAAALAHGLLLSYRQNWPESAAIFAQAREQARLHLPRADTLQNVVAGLQQLAQKPQRKSPHTAKWLSTFLPGSGQVYAGHWLKGINALGLNAMTSYALWQNIERRHFRDAVLVFSFLWMRYYLGNRAHAEEAAILANQSYQEKIMRQVYRSLEQNVRLMPAERLTLDWEDLQ